MVNMKVKIVHNAFRAFILTTMVLVNLPCAAREGVSGNLEDLDIYFMSKMGDYYGLYRKHGKLFQNRIKNAEKLFDSGDLLERNPNMAKYQISFDISRDGRYLAYGALSEKGFMDIYVENLRTGKVWNVTNDSCTDSHPVFSNSGEWIAYLFHERGDRLYDNIALVSRDGSVKEILTCHFARVSSLSFSPDDHQVLFVKYFTSRSSSVSLADIRSGKVYDLTTADCANKAPRFNGRGDKIVYTSDWYKSFDVWIMNSDGTDKRVIYESPGTEREPQFLRNDERIVFISDFMAERGAVEGGNCVLSIEVSVGDVRNLFPEKYLHKQLICSGLRVLNDTHIYFQGREVMKKRKTFYAIYGLDMDRHLMWRIVSGAFDTMDPIITVPGAIRDKR